MNSNREGRNKIESIREFLRENSDATGNKGEDQDFSAKNLQVVGQNKNKLSAKAKAGCDDDSVSYHAILPTPWPL